MQDSELKRRTLSPTTGKTATASGSLDIYDANSTYDNYRVVFLVKVGARHFHAVLTSS